MRCLNGSVVNRLVQTLLKAVILLIQGHGTIAVGLWVDQTFSGFASGCKPLLSLRFFRNLRCFYFMRSKQGSKRRLGGSEKRPGKAVNKGEGKGPRKPVKARSKPSRFKEPSHQDSKPVRDVRLKELASTDENSVAPLEKATVGVQMIEVPGDYAGQRVDNFLMTRLKGVPRSRIYRIVRKGEVRVNKKRVKPDTRLKGGDIVRIPPVRIAERESSEPGQRMKTQMELSIVYEDEGVLVLDKPSGIAVHGGSGISHGVIEAMRALRPEARFLELVHRLDRDTSGLLMVAKKRSVLRFLHEAIRNEEVQKTYITLVMGRWKGGGRRVDQPLRKSTLKSGERRVRVAADGKPSRSVFTPVERYEEATLMKVKLETGRTHQIRVHAQYSGHPVAGDRKYATDEQLADMKVKGLRRLFLHAQHLVAPLPGDRELNVTAPLPDELTRVVNALTPR